MTIRVLLLSVTISATAAALAFGLPKSTSKYEGHLAGDAHGQSEIHVAVTERQGRPRTATFSAKGILFGCDDGTRLRADYAPIRFRFVNRSTFYGDYNYIEDDQTEILVVRGELRRRNNETEIAGYVLSNKNRDAGTPDCSTFGREYWVARP